MNTKNIVIAVAIRKLNEEVISLSKVKRFKGSVGRRRGWKKAFVSLKPGQEINFVEGGNV